MADWQPIETAPKDGTRIIGFAGRHMAVVFFYARWDSWQLEVCGSYAESAEWEPQYWMPAPEPPKEDGK